LPTPKFPAIEETEVALVRVNCFTGHVLDSAFVPWQSFRTNAEVFTVFNSLDEAKNYIEAKKIDYPNAEYCVYNHVQQVIYTYQPKEKSPLPQHNLGLKFSVYPADEELRKTLCANFDTFEDSLEYVEAQKQRYPNTQFKIRDYSQNVIHTVKAKKGLWSLFEKGWA